MKACPACNTQYSDDSLVYCLQDGTPLKPGSTGTSPTDETPTVVRNRVDVPVTHVGSRSQRTEATGVSRRPSTALMAAIVVGGLLVVFAAALLGTLLYLRSSKEQTTANVQMPENNKVSDTPAARPNPSKSANTSNTSNNTAGNKNSEVSAIDFAQSKSDVSERVMNWKAASESHELGAYMANYSDHVDYYTRRNVDIATVRADKARAFSMYDSIHFNISNLSVTVAPSGNTATAVFDKEWDFRGGSTSTGKVRSQLDLRKTNGKWLITGERDLHLYYKS